MNSNIDISLNKPEQIKKLRRQIEESRSDMLLLEKSFGETDDFKKFLVAKSGLACSAIMEAVKAEEEETDRQIELLRISHKEKLSKIDSEIEAVKEKARKLLAGIEAEIDRRPAPAPAVAAPVPVPESAAVSVEGYEEASDDEIELLVKELKARKLRKMRFDEDSIESEPEPEPEPVETKEEKVIEGFWENDEDLAGNAAEEAGKDPSAADDGTKDENASKHAFILGKFAGDNLFDESGKLIIAKDEVITEDVIAKAESEGKLVDLIVDMKFS